MKVVVLGGSGLIGKKLLPLLQARGHEAKSASPSTGVNSLTGAGLAEALKGADVVVDVTNSPSFAEADVVAFFDASTRNVLAAEKAAGVRHHLALSVVGADRMGDGYMKGKVVQERLISGGGVPFTIVRATQFFEFLTGIADVSVVDGEVRLPTAKMQPMAADDVAAALADVVEAEPSNGIVDIAGPEAAPIADLVRRRLAAGGDRRKVVAGPEYRYYGIEIEDDTLTPTGRARIAPTTLNQWMVRQGFKV